MCILDHHQFDSKRIALIGNSARILEGTDGPRIDAHDLVIRFNLAWPDLAKRPSGIGTRTTHMMVGGREFKTPDKARKFDRIRAQHREVIFFSAKGDPRKWTLPKAPVPLMPDETYDELVAQMDGFTPTSGAAMLYYLVAYCSVRALSLYGFDGLQSKVWYKTQAHPFAKCHSPEAESRFLARMDQQPHVNVWPCPPER